MAGSIKGITIEIGGNTTKLSQALKGVDSQIRTLRDSLKNVDSALKLDPSNVDLLNQKQRILTQTISSTEEELKILKQAQKEYIASGKDLDGAEYTALEKKIAITEKALKNLHAEQNNFNGTVQVMGKRLESFGQNATKAGTALTAGLTTPIIGVGTAAVSMWKEIDEAYDNIVAGTGATGSVLSSLQDSFDKVYGNFPATTEDVSTAIADINTRFGLMDDELESATTQFLKYARVNNTDVSGSIEKVAKAMSDARLDTRDLNTVLDKLTYASQASGMSVDAISESLSKNGYAMRELGFTTEETIAYLTTFEKQGIDTSTMLTAFKTAVKNCETNSKDARVEVQAFFNRVSDGSATAKEAIELFGSKAGAAIYSYAQEGKLNISEMMQVIEGSADALNTSYDQMFSDSEKLTVALNNVKIAGKEMGESIMTGLAPLIEKIAQQAKRFAEWMKGLNDQQKELIVKIGLVAAAIGPLLLVVGKLSTSIAGLIKYFGSVTTMGGKVLSAIKGIIGVSSVGLGTIAALAAGIAAVAGAFYTLWNNNEAFRTKITEIWNGIVESVNRVVARIKSFLAELDFTDTLNALKAAWQSFCDFLAPVFITAFEIIAQVVEKVGVMISDFVGMITLLIRGHWDSAWELAGQIVFGFARMIENTVEMAFNQLIKSIQTFLSWFGIKWDVDLNAINQKWADMWRGALDFLAKIFDKVREIVSAIAGWIIDHWDQICSFFGPIIETAFNTVTQILTAAFDTISGIIDVFTAIFTGDWELFWNGIHDTVQAVWDGIGSIISNAINLVTHIIEEFLSWFGIEWDLSWVSQRWSDCWEWISQLLSDMVNIIQSVIGTFISLFTGDWDGFCEGIGNIWNNLWQGISDYIVGIWNGICTFLGSIFGWLFGTSQETADNISGVFTGLWQGIWDFVKFIWDTIKAFLNGIWQIIVGLASSIFSGLADFFGGLWEGISNTASTIWNGIADTLSGIWQGICDMCSSIFGGIADFFGGIWNTITGTTDNATKDVRNTIEKNWKDVDKQSVKDLQQMAKNTDKQFKEIQKNTEKVFNETNTAIKKSWSAIKKTIEEAANSIQAVAKKQFTNVQKTITDVFNQISSSLSKSCSNILNSVKSSFNNIPNAINSPLRSAYSYATSTFNNMQLYIGQCMNNSVSYVSNALRNIQNLFANFRINYPHIAVPHFSISPRGWQLGDLLQGSIPSLSIQWYAKAMSKGMILDGATIFGMQNGQLLGGGEAGKEAVVGLNSLESMIDASVDRSLRAAYESYRPDRNTQPSVEIDYDRLAQAMISGLGEVTINNTFAIGSRQIANEILPAIDKGLERRKNRR